MKLILIGHRGVGKTSLLQRIQIYYAMTGKSLECFDLDKEIEKQTEQPIEQIFSEQGEQKFRDLELEHFSKLIKKKEYAIAVGAGFLLQQADLPVDAQIIWVQRASDELVRIFLDRPRLNPELSVQQEYFERKTLRDKIFENYYSKIYLMPEGNLSPNEIEKNIILDKLVDVGGIYTVLPEDLSRKDVWKIDFDLFEVRNDLLTNEQRAEVFDKIPKEKILYSYRLQAAEPVQVFLQDWAIELGPPKMNVDFLSVHERLNNETVEQVIKRLKSFCKKNEKQKLAIKIKNFAELEKGLLWQAEDSSRRNFLPRSDDGRWSWVRCWLKEKQELNFVRTRINQFYDQPQLADWISTPDHVQRFAAVLGSPVKFSYSPAVHQEFFSELSCPYWAIHIEKEEWSKAIALLKKMGLVAASVTSPLKGKAFELGNKASEISQKTKSANTLIKDGDGWFAHNTDYDGLREVLSSVQLDKDIVVWGGGGILSTVRELLPQACFYSATTGQPRASSAEARSPTIFIWAAKPNATLPGHSWKPEIVLDMNYVENSNAKIYCQQVGAKYISGLQMFLAQAQAQQNFWERFYVSK